MESDEKTCPRCAETVKEAALVCKHCNYEFGTPVVAAPAAPVQQALAPIAPPKKKHPFLIGCASIVGILLLLGVIGSMVGPASNTTAPNTPDATAAPTPAPLQVTSVQLASAYNANEVAAQQAYGNKVLDVTGTVEGVVLDLFNDPVIHLQGVNEFLPVQAQFDKSEGSKLSAISKGQTVTVRCSSITSVISAPMLSDCTLP
jgi:hypothetical protein